MTQLGLAYTRVLPLDHQEALFAAAEILYDGMLDDQDAIRSGKWSASLEESIETSVLASELPPRYLSRYTPQFMKRFHLCLVTVIWKLGQRQPMKLSCVAEELAAHLLIQEAETWLDIHDTSADFGAFKDALFEDLDFEMLYEGRYDGVEDSDIAQEMGIVNLAFTEWFESFRDDEHALMPHPLCFAETEDGDGAE